MKIKSLTLHGFKSFADRTDLDLHEGITAVVGPNGCGKSNISDAIRWVLGEQRPTAIRGSRMEEAIFGGTTERRPIQRAEVQLAISNEDRALDVPWAEVVIGRTVYRGGESEYTLNGSACRLRDLQDLLRDTGLGANAYSAIEGGMVDAILSDRAEERRSLFEEAAEIGRYKDRRRIALRRLEQAETDLKRLEDVLSEVATKVRSLARQRGRAERYLEHRERRLQLEIAVADARLEGIERRLEKAEEELARIRTAEPAAGSELQTRETAAESLRVEIAERERRRAELAAELERIRQRLEERERARLVAAERQTAAEERLAGIRAELEEVAARRETLAGERDELERELAERTERVQALRAGRERLEAEASELRERRDDLKAEESRKVAGLEELDREIGQLRAERETRGDRLAERREELQQRLAAVERAREEEAGLEAALEEASSAEARAEERRSRLEEESLERRAELEEGRREARALRERVGTLEGELAAARSRQASLAALLSSEAELPQPVARLLEDAGSLPGVRGLLADTIRVDEADARAVEAQLGGYLHGVLVDDWEAVRRVRRWCADHDASGLLLLPMDPGPHAPSGEARAGGLVGRVRTEGPGAEWARALLSGAGLREEGEFGPADGPWVLADGSGQDRHGAVRIGQPGAGRGALSRRAELEALEERIGGLADELEGARSELARWESTLSSRQEAADEAEAELQRASRATHETASRREAAQGRLERGRSELRELESRIEQIRQALGSAESRAADDETRLEELRAGREATERELSEVRARSLEVAAEWERASSELHDRELRAARAEADADSSRERRQRVEASLSELAARQGRLAAEREELRGALEGARGVLTGGEGQVADLLERRASLEEELTAVREGLGERRERLEAEEAWLRAARQREREGSERRHALELEVAELRGQRSNIHERLEGEWDASLGELRERVEPPVEGGPAEWAAELEELREKLARLGPVNLLAAEEHAEEQERLDFLQEQRSDLVTARDDLRDSIRRINQAAAEAFRATFEEVRENFRDIFVSLFEGGDCDLWLEDPDDPLDSPIEISASPRGKRTQRIHLLSGGERALTALALLFGIYLAKPSPFCIMDEVDAPLDESNVGRFTAMLERFKDRTQFIVITHNPRTIEAADWIYGVTMQEPGVSSIVGVEFQDLPAGQVA